MDGFICKKPESPPDLPMIVINVALLEADLSPWVYTGSLQQFQSHYYVTQVIT